MNDPSTTRPSAQESAAIDSGAQTGSAARDVDNFPETWRDYDQCVGPLLTQVQRYRNVLVRPFFHQRALRPGEEQRGWAPTYSSKHSARFLLSVFIGIANKSRGVDGHSSPTCDSERPKAGPRAIDVPLQTGQPVGQEGGRDSSTHRVASCTCFRLPSSQQRTGKKGDLPGIEFCRRLIAHAGEDWNGSVAFTAVSVAPFHALTQRLKRHTGPFRA